MSRISTGIPALDSLLGGGLIPGTLTVVVGATGIGKTQLGLQFANAGTKQEGRPGMIFDMSARGDSQNHADYAQRMFGWKMESMDPEPAVELNNFFDSSRSFGDYLHIFSYSGRKVTRQDLDWDEWRNWQSELNSRLQAAIAFFYGNFVQGKRRVVIDGIEPVDRPGESIQFHLFDYVLHQILRKDCQWVARDLFREQYRRHAEEAAAHVYETSELCSLLSVTSQEIMLDDLISKPLVEGDELANANTLILMGKTRDGNKLGRALYISKHRGSACEEAIIPYRIEDGGLVLL